MRHLTTLAVLLSIGTVGGTALATPLNLSQMNPDIMSIGNVVSYNADTNQFTEQGRPVSLTAVDSTPYNITSTLATSYVLTAFIDDAGLATSGTLTIGGKIASLGATSGTLLTGTLQAFGYSNASNGDPLEFIFTVTGGDLAGLMGSEVGVLLSAKSTNYIDWEHSFSSGSGATNDTFAVPEPAALALLALGGCTLLRRRHEGVI